MRTKRATQRTRGTQRTTQALLNHSTSQISDTEARAAATRTVPTKHGRASRRTNCRARNEQSPSAESKTTRAADWTRTSNSLRRTCAHRVATQAPHPRQRNVHNKGTRMPKDHRPQRRWTNDDGTKGNSIRPRQTQTNSTRQGHLSLISYGDAPNRRSDRWNKEDDSDWARQRPIRDSLLVGPATHLGDTRRLQRVDAANGPWTRQESQNTVSALAHASTSEPYKRTSLNTTITRG